MPNRFLCFSGKRGSNRGGWEDFKGSYGGLQEAIDENPIAKPGWTGADWRHVVDIKTRTIVSSVPINERSKLDEVRLESACRAMCKPSGLSAWQNNMPYAEAAIRAYLAGTLS